MSSRFAIELPSIRPPLSDLLLVFLTCVFFTGPLLVLGTILGDHTLPALIMGSSNSLAPLGALLLFSSIAGAACGVVFIHIELKRYRLEQAEAYLKQALQKLGYVAIDPIEVNDDHVTAQLRDEEGVALWDVFVVKNRVMCTKRRW